MSGRGRSRGSSRGFLSSRGNFGMSRDFKYKSSMHSSRNFENKRHDSFEMKEERPMGKRRDYASREHQLEKNESRHSMREGHDDSHTSGSKLYHSKFMHSAKNFAKDFYPSHNVRGRDSFHSRGNRDSFSSRGRGFSRGSTRGFRNEGSFGHNMDYRSRGSDGGMSNFKREKMMEHRRPFRADKDFSDDKEFDRDRRYNKCKDNEEREYKNMRSWNDRPYKKPSQHFDSDPRSRKRFNDYENPSSKFMRYKNNSKPNFYEEEEDDEEMFSDEDIDNHHRKRTKFDKESHQRNRRSQSSHHEEEEEEEEDEEGDHDHKRESCEDPKKQTSSSSGVQVTIRRDGERAVNSEGHKTSRFSGKLFIDLRCPHCPGQGSVTFQEYRFHLDSKKHDYNIRELAYKHSLILRKIRLQQRNTQREMEDQWSKDKPEEFEASVSRYCKGCKLAFKCNGEDDTKEISVHNDSKLHKVQQQYSFPRCPMCSMSFPSRMGYEYHIASIRHLRRKAETKEEENCGHVSDDQENDEVNLDDFITMDSVGEDDLGSEHDEIVGNAEDLKAAKEDDEDINGDKKAHHHDDDDAEEEDEEDDKFDNEEPTVGKEFIIPVEAAYCKLCRDFILLDGKMTNAVDVHCKGYFHTKSYEEHMEQFDISGSSKVNDGDPDDLYSDNDDDNLVRRRLEADEEDMECVELETLPLDDHPEDDEKKTDIEENALVYDEDENLLEDDGEENALKDERKTSHADEEGNANGNEEGKGSVFQEIGETLEDIKFENNDGAKTSSHKKSTTRKSRSSKS